MRLIHLPPLFGRRGRSAVALLGLSCALAACFSGHDQADPPAEPDKPMASLRTSGIARYKGKTTCTAALIDTGFDDKPAYALTSGHCAQSMSHGSSGSAIWRDVPAPDDRLTFNYENADTKDDVVLGVRSVRYSTMNGRDIAVLELPARLGELKKKGLMAYALSAAPAPTGAPIVVAGAAQAGYVQKISCEQGAPARVLESIWYWPQSLANNCAGIVAGYSGSPVFNGRHALTSIINTTNLGVEPSHHCLLGMPCEVTPEGVQMKRDTSYAQDVSFIGRCFQQGVWQPEQSGCPLPLRSGPVVVPLKTVFSQTLLKAVGALLSYPQQEQQPLTGVMFKMGQAARTDCAQPAGYQALNPATPTASYMPTQEGHYLLCFKSGSQGQSAVTTVPLEVDNTAPTRKPDVVGSLETGGIAVTLTPHSPELEFYAYAIIDKTQSCEGADLQDHNGIPLSLAVGQSLCVAGVDYALNQGRVWKFDF